MSDIFKDWVSFKEGDKDFDMSYFDNLFENHLNRSNYNFLFSGMDLSDEVIERIIEVKSFKNKNPEKFYEPKYIESIIKLDIKEKLEILKVNGEQSLADELEEIREIELCNYDRLLKVKKEDWPQGEFDVCLNDIFIDNMKWNNKIYYALNEAVYHIAYDYNINWYILNYICSVNFNMSHYLSLYKMGYEYAYSEEKILYASNIKMK